MKCFFVHVGLPAGELWLGATAFATNPSGVPQHAAARGVEAWLQTNESVCVGDQRPPTLTTRCSPAAEWPEIVQSAVLGHPLLVHQAEGRVWDWQSHGFLQPRPLQGLHRKVTQMSRGVYRDPRLCSFRVTRRTPFQMQVVQARRPSSSSPLPCRAQ